MARWPACSCRAKLNSGACSRVSRRHKFQEYPQARWFSRAQGRLQLTPEGAALLKEVERHFSGLESIRLAAHRIAEHGPGSLLIVGFPSMTSELLPRAIAELLTRHPDTATLDKHTTDQIAASIGSGHYDVGFTAGAISQGRTLGTRIIISRPWLCAFPASHRLAQRAQISLRDLTGEALVGFSPGMSLRAQTDQMFTKSGLTARYALYAQTIESMWALVATGCGAAIINPYAKHVARMHGLSAPAINDAQI